MNQPTSSEICASFWYFSNWARALRTYGEFDSSLVTFTVRPGTPLAEVEKLLIRQTLMHVTRNRSAAAQALGISRRALQYKLKQYGLLEEDRVAEEANVAPP